MELSFASFVQQDFSSPAMLVTVLLTLGVIFVNGWTDAPNAIATCIATRCINVRAAILTSAVFNFLGVLIMTHINSSVASTISNMVDFGGNTHEALIALCAALFSIVVYSVGAARFGIPTSESHSLIAGLTGAAIAIQNGIGGINMGEWVKVLYGLVLSLALRFLPTLAREAHVVIDAQSARGGDIETGSPAKRLRALTAIVVPVFAGTLRHADNLALALDARCYEEGAHRTHWRRMRVRRRDLLFITVAMLYLFALMALQMP